MIDLTIVLISHLQSTRFFDFCNPSGLFFCSLIRFLINRISYPLRNNRFRKRTSRFPSLKTQDLNDGLD